MGKKGEDTRQMIREAARRLFEKRGFHQVTMKDICAATGLSRGGLYGHYESTGQIFATLMENLLEQQNTELELKRGSNVSAVQILEDILDQYAAEMIDSEHSLSLAIFEYYSQFPGDQDNELVRQYHNSRTMWQKLLRYGIETGVFREVDVDAVFDLIAFSYQGVRMYSQIVTIEAEIPRRMIRLIKALVLKEEVSEDEETKTITSR